MSSSKALYSTRSKVSVLPHPERRRFSAAREAAGISRAAIARRIGGTDQNLIAQWELRTSEPRIAERYFEALQAEIAGESVPAPTAPLPIETRSIRRSRYYIRKRLLDHLGVRS